MNRRDRELIAQMAAAIYPHVLDYNGGKPKEEMAVDAALRVLLAVDEQFWKQSQNKQAAGIK